ncbi:MAG: aldose 1-epimerase family protein [Clostridiales bacterium]|nr:aldose 1-epimerase family protein [Clostridiales bacterium]
MGNVCISSGIVKAVISDMGAQMTSLKKDGREIIWEGDPAVWGEQAPFLFPICGRLRDNKYMLDNKEYHLGLHGFARTMPFEIETQSENEVTFLLKSTEETMKCFPRTFECRITYRLIKNCMEVTYDVKNTDAETMYFSMGAHEGYACPEGIEEYSVVFEHEENLETVVLDGGYLSRENSVIAQNTRELPLKYEYFDDNSLVFKKLRSRRVSLRRKNGMECVSVDFCGFDNLLLWTEPGAGYICIEPWCGLPDYSDGDYDITRKEGIITLAPGGHCVRRHTIIL